jgi:N-acetylglucosaminyldiphosphoundecaprenol N-acetyl-beta-D-mannosaminyltransferase
VSDALHAIRPVNDIDIDKVRSAPRADDLAREVYCILGTPVDAIEMPAVLQRIKAAVASAAAFTISTPNLNFLVNSQSDREFRETLLLSDLSPTDGMPIVWIAQLMGIPIKHRISGSDIFEALKAPDGTGRPLKVFLFGGAEGVAAAASKALNVEPSGLACVGTMCPGFGTVDEMSRDEVIQEINSSRADFLVAALGAKKGQLWLQRNHHRLRIPIRAHLGATINFQAGTIKRAPRMLRKLGLEWLWRIKEEPHLWQRYWHDGIVLLHELVTCVLPLALWTRWQRLRWHPARHNLFIQQVQDDESVTLALFGAATARHVHKAISCFRDALVAGKKITVDLSHTRLVDARFLGLLLMLRKRLKEQQLGLELAGVSSRLERWFHLNGVGFLLSE